MTTPIVALHDVHRMFGAGPQAVTALDGVSIELTANTFTAVMGPSGSGKSTLLHCAAGLDRPTSGEITIDGVALGPLDETGLTLLRRDRIGFVFQAFNLISSLTAAHNVELPARLAGRSPDPAAVTEALRAVGLGDRAEHLPSQLSGGEQQRVAIARALFTRPAVVFADEPTGALDARSSRQVLDLLQSLVADHGHCVVMVTHDPVAAATADEVLMLTDGRLADRMVKTDATAIAARMAVLETTC